MDKSSLRDFLFAVQPFTLYNFLKFFVSPSTIGSVHFYFPSFIDVNSPLASLEPVEFSKVF